MSQSAIDYSGNIERFSGFADVYDKYRPSPPQILAEVLTRLADTPSPDLVVDLGSGTGLSTRYWAGKARRVVGIEPTADMRRQADTQNAFENVTFLEGFGHATGLPDACARIVTVAQAFHWMEPQTTLAEAARLLQTGGVFAAYDYDWPPATGKWEADKAFADCMHRTAILQADLPQDARVKRWEKSGHLERIKNSGHFRYVNEILLHHTDLGNAERLAGLALSQGGVMTLLKSSTTETEVGLSQLKAIANRVLGSQEREWVWSSRVRIGIK